MEAVKKAKRLDLLDESRSPLRNIVLLAWPIFLENVLSTLVSYADTAMVGSLGAYATASVSISNSVVSEEIPQWPCARAYAPSWI